MIAPLAWNEAEFRVDLLDQTGLPHAEVWRPIETPEAMAEAIEQLRVRGAPAIGVAAAYGVVLALRGRPARPRWAVTAAADLLATTRPTAVNLFWALRRMRTVAEVTRPGALRSRLLQEAHAILAEDRAAGRALGRHGLGLLEGAASVLTHCHAGGVATSGYGTALAPLFLAHERGAPVHVFVDETRPLLQGSRITAWELQKAGVDCTVITDSMAGHVMQTRRVDAVIVGADRIAANGDTANKIGTYGLAVLAAAHRIPFYVAAPLSTFDLRCETGAQIPIEERDAREVAEGFGRPTAPEGVRIYNPAFDVTPARLVAAFVTERGVLRPPFGPAIARAAAEQKARPETYDA